MVTEWLEKEWANPKGNLEVNRKFYFVPALPKVLQYYFHRVLFDIWSHLLL